MYILGFATVIALEHVLYETFNKVVTGPPEDVSRRSSPQIVGLY